MILGEVVLLLQEKKKKMKRMRAGVKVIDRSFYSNRRLQGHHEEGNDCRDQDEEGE